MEDKDTLIERLKAYQMTLRAHVSTLQKEVRYWAKKYGKIDNLVKNGGEKKK